MRVRVSPVRGRNTLVLLVVVLMVAAPLASAWPTPGFNGEAARQVTGRIFPEARQTNDFVSYQEARDGLQLLEEENPDLLEFVDVGRSVGWMDPVTGERAPSQVFAVLLTNEDSGVPDHARINLLFQLSIHGNEKGGREGAFRVIEDFVLAKASGEDVGVATQERLAMLDHMRIIFTFPNPDGWTHEELMYRWNDACYQSLTCDYASGNDEAGGIGLERASYVRVNGNGTDLNRQSPVLGFVAEDHRPMAEPETRTLFRWLRTDFHRIHYAADLHGMRDVSDGDSTAREPVCVGVADLESVCTQEGYFVLGLLPSSPMDPTRAAQTTALAELANDRVNAHPSFDTWKQLPPAQAVDGKVGAWGTVWDTLGYTDTGFTGDWMAQPHGLDAVGVYYEYAYNNRLMDNRYDAAGMEINRMHIGATRAIIGGFLDFAAGTDGSAGSDSAGSGSGSAARLTAPGSVADTAGPADPVNLADPADPARPTGLRAGPLVDTAGVTVGYVPTDIVRRPPAMADRGIPPKARDFAMADYAASPNDFFTDLRGTLTDPDALVRLEPGTLPQRMADVDVLVVPGSAVLDLSAADVQAIDAFVHDGGRLVATDSALTLVSDLGIDAGMDEHNVFAGYADPDRDHPLFAGVRGLARQLVEPIPLGYPLGTMPLRTLDAQAVRDADGRVAGTSPTEDRASVGVLPHGDGEIVFVGSLLPDPFIEEHHPFGLAGHAVTYTGHQVFRNAVGWSLTEGPVEAGSIPSDAGGAVLPAPGPAWVLAAVLVATAAVARVRRSREAET